SGEMIVESVAASALARLRGLAHPAGLQTVTLSRGVEQGASFAAQAATQALDAVGQYRVVTAAESVAAARALVQSGHPVPSDLELAWLPADMADRDLSEDLARAADALDPLAERAAQIMSSSGRNSSA
ncbi:MAG: aromatic amino acid lyase, partial [Actinobacteria bacterium]|nr:aromatic amino acid lyase [Actinomycetota bacterium]